MSQAAHRQRWLGIATRAQAYRCLLGQEELQQAQQSCQQAQQRRDQQAAELPGLLQAWQDSRAANRAGGELDAQFRRYHQYLQIRLDGGEAALTQCRDAVEAASQALSQSLGLKRALERLGDRWLQAERLQRQGHELRQAAEAWLIAQHGADPS